MGDPVLMPLMRASDDETRRQELETLVVECATRTIRNVIGRFSRSDHALVRDDAEDILSIVLARLVRRLQSVELMETKLIDDFENYVATLTYRTIHDYMRERFPERTRLKNRLRYLLKKDARFALWSTPHGLACGLRAWEGRTDAAETLALTRAGASRVMCDARDPAAAVLAVFHSAGRPVRLEALVSAAAELWGVKEASVDRHDDDVADPGPSHADRYESRQLLEALWREINELPGRHRAALLLNLRETSGVNAVALFLLAGVATFAEIADAAGLTPEELTAIWPTLPLDDLAIASRLGISRQQVINFRRAARERLARRIDSNRYERRR